MPYVVEDSIRRRREPQGFAVGPTDYVACDGAGHASGSDVREIDSLVPGTRIWIDYRRTGMRGCALRCS
jgi:hypothetical protein